MIIEGILNVLKSAFDMIFGLLPTVSIGLPDGFMEWFTNVVSMSAYFLPLPDFFAMMGIWFLVTNFQIVWKLVQRIWDSIPFV